MLSKKQEISNHAARLFRKKGYKATSMRDIAKAMDMKAASLYNHITSKEELFSELLLKIAELFTKGMGEIVHSSLSTSAKLEQVIALHIQLTIDHTDAISLINGEWVHLTPVPMEQYIKHRDDYEKEFRAIINQGKQEGLYTDIDTDVILFTLLSTLRSLYSWYSKNRDYSTRELENQMKRCLLYGISQ